MPVNTFYPPNDALDPEERQLANRALLHDKEMLPEGREEIRKLAYNQRRFQDSRLQTRVGSLTFENPLGVAAGWDKFGESVIGLHELGFGAIEVGTIPRYAQPGNPKPRHFILAPGVMLNRYGFNSPGAESVKKNLQRYRDSRVPVGINIGKNKDVSLEQAPEDHAFVAKLLYDEATYFSLGVSSPNTTDVRAQQAKSILSQIAKAVQDVIREQEEVKPVFVKVAPDLTPAQLEDIIEVVFETGLSGIIAANTVPDGNLKAQYGEKWRNELGGLSGDDSAYRELSTKMIGFIHRETNGELLVIGAGGVKNTETAVEKLLAGASAVQIMTALQFVGPSLPGRINEGLVEFMDKEGVAKISDLVGTKSS